MSTKSRARAHEGSPTADDQRSIATACNCRGRIDGSGPIGLTEICKAAKRRGAIHNDLEENNIREDKFPIRRSIPRNP